jgi:hypothetical protein
MHWLKPIAFCLSLLTPAALLAQSKPDALDPRAPVPPRNHCSVLRVAAPVSEPQAREWRQANARVQQAGGWRQYAQEAARDAERAPPAPCQPAEEKLR